MKFKFNASFFYPIMQKFKICKIIIITLVLFIMTFSRSGRINEYGNFDRRYARGSGRTPRQRSGSLYRRPRNLVRYPRQTSGYLYQNASYFSMSSWSNTWFFYQSISYF